MLRVIARGLSLYRGLIRWRVNIIDPMIGRLLITSLLLSHLVIGDDDSLQRPSPADNASAFFFLIYRICVRRGRGVMLMRTRMLLISRRCYIKKKKEEGKKNICSV